MEQEKWKRFDGSSVVFDGEGRMKMLATCKCGATAWVRQGKVFKRFFTGKCPSCGAFLLARIKRVRVNATEGEDGEYRIRDVDLLTAHVVDVAIREMDPILYDAAMMLRELSEKHWSECWMIGVYSDTDEKARRLVAATTMEPLTVDGVKDSANAVKTIWTESDLDNLSSDDGTVRYYTD